MRAFLEKNDKEWLDDFVYISRQPLLDRGWEVIAFDGNNLDSLLHRKDLDKRIDMVIGSVEATTKFFERVGMEVPGYLGYPESLKKYLLRDVSKMKFSDLSNRIMPYFVKPADQVKKFTGTIVNSPSTLEILKKFDFVDKTDLLYVCDLVDICSEYRCFIGRGEIKGIKHYSGDFKIFPDLSVIKSMVSDYIDSPSAYTLDVAILSDGRTCLIEVNDMWAIGSYGLDGKTYISMCIDRWLELARKK